MNRANKFNDFVEDQISSNAGLSRTCYWQLNFHMYGRQIRNFERREFLEMNL